MEEPFDEAERYGPVLRFGFFLVGPLEFRERGSGNPPGLEPLVAVGLTARAIGPAAFLRYVEWARWIDGRRAPMSRADADELDEGAVHSPRVCQYRQGCGSHDR